MKTNFVCEQYPAKWISAGSSYSVRRARFIKVRLNLWDARPIGDAAVVLDPSGNILALFQKYQDAKLAAYLKSKYYGE